MVHRDLKPANVMVDEEERPHITDFGLAKWTGDQSEMTLHGQLLGTPAYMAPEQARGDVGSVDRRTDVYALGVILYEMLTGRCPFSGEPATVIQAVVEQDPTSPRALEPRTPRNLETICLRAMEKEARRRYPSAQEMAVDLRRYLRGEPILSRRIGPLGRGWRWVRRHPAATAALLLAFASIAASITAAVLAGKNQELAGWQTIHQATEPAGAKVAYVPLDDVTGEPDLAKTIYASGQSPVELEVLPGDYHVVAVLADGRFHEVIRHVPDRAEGLLGAHNHRESKRRPDGTIVLPKIEIPSTPVSEGMAFMAGRNDFKMGVPGSSELPLHTRNVTSFYIASTEFTNSDYRKRRSKAA